MSDDDAHRRIHPRFECELPATVVVGGEEYAARATNVSLGGLFLIMDDNGPPEAALPYGTECTVKIGLPALDNPAEIHVTVRWVTEEGVGVQFGSLRAMEVWGFHKFFEAL